MKTTIRQLIESSNIEPTLIRAVIKQLGGIDAFNDNYQDICNHGNSGGYSGFIYYSDTIPFAKKHKKSILKLAKDQAEEFGMSPLEMIAGFNCFRDFEKDDVFNFLTGIDSNEDSETVILNGLAWYAAEEVCRVAEYIKEL